MMMRHSLLATVICFATVVDGIARAPLSDSNIVAAAHLPGIDTSNEPYAKGPFGCDALVNRKCSQSGLIVAQCGTLSESSSAVGANSAFSASTSVAPTRNVRHDADGYKREFKWYTCLPPIVDSGGREGFRKLIDQQAGVSIAPDGSCVDVNAAPIACLESRFSPTGTSVVDIKIHKQDPTRLSSSGQGVFCTCYHRVDGVGMSFEGGNVRKITDQFPLDRQYPDGPPQRPYSGQASDYFQPQHYVDDGSDL